MTPVIFINCRLFPFIDLIIRGIKIYETRTRNTLGKLTNRTVYLAETGRGKKPVIRASAVMLDPVTVHYQDIWEIFRPHCAIEPESAYDWQADTKRKVLYPVIYVKEVEPFDLPDGCIRHGRVWAELETAQNL